MKTLRLLLAQAAVVCAVGAFGEVRVDTELPAEETFEKLTGDITQVFVGDIRSKINNALDSREYDATFRAEGIADIEKIGLAYCKNRVELCR